MGDTVGAAKNGNGSIRLSRAMLALILAIAGPTMAAGIARYRIGQLEVRLEAQRADSEMRLRALERAVYKFEATTAAVEKQTDVIEGLRLSVVRLTTEQERDGRERRSEQRTDQRTR